MFTIMRILHLLFTGRRWVTVVTMIEVALTKFFGATMAMVHVHKILIWVLDGA